MNAVHLPYTLQTYVGMAMYNGLPLERHPPTHQRAGSHQYLPAWLKDCFDAPKVNDFSKYLCHDWESEMGVTYAAGMCIRRGQGLFSTGPPRLARFCHNIDACMSHIKVYDLMTFIRTRTRLDLEQGAAAIVSAFFNDGRIGDAARLAQELTGVLATSCMWIEEDATLPSRCGTKAGFGHFVQKVNARCAKADAMIDYPSTYAALIPILLRIRRVAPSNRCFYVPKWVFEEAGLEPPEYMQAFYAANTNSEDSFAGNRWPTQSPSADSIILSRNSFRTIQRRLLRLYRFRKPTVALRHDIHDLEDQVLYASSEIGKKLRETENVAQIAFWFFYYQRRLQRKVISGYIPSMMGFLGKGCGAKLYQNNLSIKSSFEKVLADIAGLSTADTLAAGEDTIALLDRTCLLMKRYVDVYGQGFKENLIFRKGRAGGSGRGSVGEYNLLCDILNQLKDRAKKESISPIPGPVYKFLAKDIMHWNTAWEDDAFANGRIHGWELYLAERGLARQALPIQLATKTK